ncbi:MAG: Bax inhibitor-1/YccA family protein [Aeriscardovia sp.]|nr:Bax inhibitor-1/YccA family protein [Aeriscardovia sp.]
MFGPNGQGQNYTNPGFYNGDGYVVREKAMRSLLIRSYGEMCIGLLVTAVAAFISAYTGLLYDFIASTGAVGWIIICIAQIVFAVVLSARMWKLKPATARILFYAYALLMGFTLASIFYVFNFGTIFVALLFSAGFFFCLTMLAMSTKKNLLKLGPVLWAGLVVFVIGEVILFFVHASAATMFISAIGLVLFAGLTLYDVQWIKKVLEPRCHTEVQYKQASIFAALNLYLDFINIFLSLLQLFGGRGGGRR